MAGNSSLKHELSVTFVMLQSKCKLDLYGVKIVVFLNQKDISVMVHVLNKNDSPQSVL